MNLIHFQGLNCYHDCVISIANYFGLNYSEAFATLWSETDFSYDQYRKAYLTKRMLANLESLGAKAEVFACHSPKDSSENLSLFHEGEFMIVGMDAFNIPWNQFYQIFRVPHYFIAQNAKLETLLCFDPTYNKKNEEITRREIIAHSFEIGHIGMVARKSPQIEAIHEAREIIRTHPNTRQVLLSRIYDCVNGEQKNIVLLAKYIDAMIRNRYLYRFFLKNQPVTCDENHLFLSAGFFQKWTAVKNALYKASISRSNDSIINEICVHFNHVIDEEIAMAEKIIRGV